MEKPIPCELVDWALFNELSRQLAQQIRSANIAVDMIVGIGRGGYMPARLLSDLLGVFNLTDFKIEHYLGARKSKQAIVKYGLNAPVDDRIILLVDDVSDSGDTFKVALDHMHSLGTPRKIHTAALHHKIVASYTPDFFAAKVEQWRWIIYPWAINEDLSSFIAETDFENKSIGQLSNYLSENHGIRVSDNQIQDALQLLKSRISRFTDKG